MSTQRSYTTQAHHLLQNNRGDFFTAEEVADSLGCCEGHARNCLHSLADDPGTDVEKNRGSIEVFGVFIGGNFKPQKSDRQYLLDIVRDHSPLDLSKAQSMSYSELWSFIVEEIADSEAEIETDTLAFGIP